MHRTFSSKSWALDSPFTQPGKITLGDLQRFHHEHAPRLRWMVQVVRERLEMMRRNFPQVLLTMAAVEGVEYTRCVEHDSVAIERLWQHFFARTQSIPFDEAYHVQLWNSWDNLRVIGWDRLASEQNREAFLQSIHAIDDARAHLYYRRHETHHSPRIPELRRATLTPGNKEEIQPVHEGSTPSDGVPMTTKVEASTPTRDATLPKYSDVDVGNPDQD